MRSRKALFGNPNLLDETTDITSIDDKQKLEAERINQKLYYYSMGNTNKLVAYLGTFGSGKSVILNYIRRNDEELKNPKYQWVNFEIWRYASRKQIWDSFVAETISTIKNEESPLNVVKDIEGNPRRGFLSILDDFTRRNPIIFSILIIVCWAFASWFVWNWLSLGSGVQNEFAKALIKYSLPMLFIALTFFGISSLMPKPGRPLSRVFEYENKLAAALKELKKPVIIVIEDSDRTEDGEGFVFLETLKLFIQRMNNEIDKRIIAVAPQNTTYFNAVQRKSSDHFDRVMKIYDFAIYSSVSKIETSQIEQLIKNLKVNSAYNESIKMVTTKLCDTFNDQLSFRIIKFMLRETSEFYEANRNVNPAAALVLIASKYISVPFGSYTGKSGTELASNKLLGHHILRNSPSPDPSIKFAVILSSLAGRDSPSDSYTIEYVDKIVLEVIDKTNNSGMVVGAIIRLNTAHKTIIA